jgi:hypothetical protein
MSVTPGFIRAMPVYSSHARAVLGISQFLPASPVRKNWQTLGDVPAW